jgi:hypothetical protein
MQPTHTIRRVADVTRVAVLLLALLAVTGCGAPATTVSTAPATLSPDLIGPAASRSTESASDGTFSVTLSVPATTHHAADALDVFATLTYGGPEPSIAVDGDSMGLVAFTFTQLDGTRSMVPVSDLMCAAPTTLQRQVGATFRPVKSIGWIAEDPNAAFYKQWASDPQVHLPPGRWQILATAQIYVGTACYGGTPDHKLVTPPLVLDVAP